MEDQNKTYFKSKNSVYNSLFREKRLLFRDRPSREPQNLHDAKEYLRQKYDKPKNSLAVEFKDTIDRGEVEIKSDQNEHPNNALQRIAQKIYPGNKHAAKIAFYEIQSAFYEHVNKHGLNINLSKIGGYRLERGVIYALDKNGRKLPNTEFKAMSSVRKRYLKFREKQVAKSKIARKEIRAKTVKEAIKKTPLLKHITEKEPYRNFVIPVQGAATNKVIVIFGKGNRRLTRQQKRWENRTKVHYLFAKNSIDPGTLATFRYPNGKTFQAVWSRTRRWGETFIKLKKDGTKSSRRALIFNHTEITFEGGKYKAKESNKKAPTAKKSNETVPKQGFTFASGYLNELPKIYRGAQTLQDIADATFRKYSRFMKHVGINADEYLKQLIAANPKIKDKTGNKALTKNDYITIPHPKENPNLKNKEQKEKAQQKTEKYKKAVSRERMQILLELNKDDLNRKYQTKDRETQHRLYWEENLNKTYDARAFRGMANLKHALIRPPFEGLTVPNKNVKINSANLPKAILEIYHHGYTPERLINHFKIPTGYNNGHEAIKAFLRYRDMFSTDGRLTTTAINEIFATIRKKLNVKTNTPKVIKYANDDIKRVTKTFRRLSTVVYGSIRVLRAMQRLKYVPQKRIQLNEQFPTLDKIPSTDKIPSGTYFYSARAIIEKKPRTKSKHQRSEYEFNEAMGDKFKLGIAPELTKNLNEALTQRAKEEARISGEKVPNSVPTLKNTDILRILFAQYTIDELIKEKHIKKKGEKTIIMSLPRAFLIAATVGYNDTVDTNDAPSFKYKAPNPPATAREKRIATTITNIIIRNEQARSNVDKLTLTPDKLAEKRIFDIFGRGDGSKTHLSVLQWFSGKFSGKDVRSRPLTFKDLDGETKSLYKNAYLKAIAPRAASIKLIQELREDPRYGQEDVWNLLQEKLMKLVRVGARVQQALNGQNGTDITVYSEALTVENLKNGSLLRPEHRETLGVILAGFAAREGAQDSKETVAMRRLIKERSKDPLYKKLFEKGIHKKLGLKAQDIAKWPKVLTTHIKLNFVIDVTKGIDATDVLQAAQVRIETPIKNSDHKFVFTLPAYKAVQRGLIPLSALPPALATKFQKAGNYKDKHGNQIGGWKVGLYAGTDEVAAMGEANIHIKGGYSKFIRGRASASLLHGISAEGAIGVKWDADIAAKERINGQLKKLGWQKIITKIKRTNSPAERFRIMSSHPQLNGLANFLHDELHMDEAQAVHFFLTYIITQKWDMSQKSWKSPVFAGASLEGRVSLGLQGFEAYAGASLSFVWFGKTFMIPTMSKRTRQLMGRHGNKLADAQIAAAYRRKYPNAIVPNFVLKERTNKVLYNEKGQPVLLLQDRKRATLRKNSEFSKYKEILKRQGLDAELITTGPKKGLIKLNIIKSHYFRDTDVEFHIDPQMEKSGLIIENNGDGSKSLYLSASRVRNLSITRYRYRYPRKHQGAYQNIKFVITDNPHRGSSAVLNEEKHFILQRYGYQMERRAGAGNDRNDTLASNTITYKEYQKQNIAGKRGSFERWQEKPSLKRYYEYRNRVLRRVRLSGKERITAYRKNKIDTAISKIRNSKKYRHLLYEYKVISTQTLENGLKTNDAQVAKFSKVIGKIAGLGNLTLREVQYTMLKMASESFTNVNWSRKFLPVILGSKSWKGRFPGVDKVMTRVNSKYPWARKIINKTLKGLPKSRQAELLKNPDQLAKLIRDTIAKRHHYHTAKMLTKLVFAGQREFGISTYSSRAEMLKYINTHLSKTNLDANGKNYSIQQGLSFLSVTLSSMKLGKQGKEYFNGLRTSNLYGLENNYRLVNVKALNANEKGPGGDLARLIIAAQEGVPKDLNNRRALLRSKTAIKILGMNSFPDMIGNQAEAMAVLKMMSQAHSNKRLSNTPAAKRGYAKLKEIISRIEDARNHGGNATLYGKYVIAFSNKVELGVYTRCANPTFVYNGRFNLLTIKQAKQAVREGTIDLYLGGKVVKSVTQLTTKVGIKASAKIPTKPPVKNPPTEKLKKKNPVTNLSKTNPAKRGKDFKKKSSF